ncbi:acetyl-CoA synthetase-like protein [Aspergillus sclerotiicarbonarius CBS 121057]|uniref:Acetyl-CoA synthetase-like protein n=1 Tax=Aspergillus sclerotiicarbonarius (strain CBS 121057 / IBT 28362) TaxID=1448318 RepID=A0A319EBR6_ASPSB|nr:acetyl-CoA synthetase-like protein [Aspergillus sclerotiicarbonarius CBS 121057]
MVHHSPEGAIALPNQPIWSWLFENAPERHDEGFVDGTTGDRLSYAQVKDSATCISTSLQRKHGLQPQDTVCILSANTIWWPVAMFAVLRSGGVVMGASPASTLDELAYALQVSESRFLITAPELAGVAREAASRVGIPPTRVLLLEGAQDGMESVQMLMSQAIHYEPTAPFAFRAGETANNVCALLCLSSGTSGLPKAVMISHQNVIAQCLQTQRVAAPSLRKVAGILPAYHVTGLLHIMHFPILINATVVFLRSYSLENMLAMVQRHRLEELLLVPPILLHLVNSPVTAKYDLSSIRRFSSGAAPLSRELLQKLAAEFPWTTFKHAYGMTETSSCVTMTPTRFYGYETGDAVGTVFPGTVVKIVRERPDGSGEVEAGVDEPGELRVRGPQIMMGYRGNEALTREAFDQEGWLCTGDEATIDARGLVRIVDRKKDMIKVKGIGVAPAELEGVVLAHAAVQDCAVLGVPDAAAGERPKAFVVLKPTHQASEALKEDLLAFVRERRARFKWVREVQFGESIPKSPSGKILRVTYIRHHQDLPDQHVISA